MKMVFNHYIILGCIDSEYGTPSVYISLFSVTIVHCATIKSCSEICKYIQRTLCAEPLTIKN